MTKLKTEIVIHASSDYAKGVAAKFNLIIDGTIVARNLTATADHKTGQWGDITVPVTLTENVKSIKLEFTNDYAGSGADRNLFIKGITVHGVNLPPSEASYTNAYLQNNVSSLYGGGASISYNVAGRDDILPINHPPVAHDDAISTHEDVAVTIKASKLLANDTDPDGNTLKITAVNGAVLNSNGTITYTPTHGFSGHTSFSYTVSDGKGGTDIGAVDVNVIHVNHAPDAKDDAVSTQQDTPMTITAAQLLANDTDVDGETLKITAVNGAVLNSDGTITYTPAAGFSGDSSFTYTISDGKGGNDTATVNVSVTPAPPVHEEFGLISNTATPASPAVDDSNSVELGMKFQPLTSGDVTGVQFYKGDASNGGIHTGHLWAADGTLLGEVIFSNETASGWQTAYFATPIHVNANTQYVISYHAPQGHYAGDNAGFAQPIQNDALSAPTSAGVYAYDTNAHFPDSSYQATNYYVDVVFEKGTTPPPETGDKVYYVSTTGSDSGDGSAASPWKTINHAMSANLGAGDTVLVKAGTYTEQVFITHGGSADGYVTLRSEVPGGAHIVAPADTYSTVNLRANYVSVEGFDIVGGGGHGIDAEGVHHTQVLGNVVHNSGGSGIQYNASEFIRIEGNETYANAGTNGFQTSGISVYQARNISGDTTTDGYRIIVKNNISHDNVETSAINFDHTDGNGIIIDDFQSTQNTAFTPYQFKTLVENNLAYGNGGKGIQVTWSDHVTVMGNTVWHNNIDNLNSGTWRGELNNQQSSDNVWVNNIAVTDPSVNANNTAIGNYSYGGYVNQGVVWENNITYNGTAGQASVKTDGGNAAPDAAHGNQLGVDPGFVAPGSDFHIASGSAAIDAGTAGYGLPADDLGGHARVVGSAVDIGAYEYGNAQTQSFFNAMYHTDALPEDDVHSLFTHSVNDFSM